MHHDLGPRRPGRRPTRTWAARGIAAVAVFIQAALFAGCADDQATTLEDGVGEAVSPHNTLSDAEKAAGWQLLFDGESFAGWRGLGREAVPTNHWVISDGTIHKIATADVPRAADGQVLEGGDLLTEATWESFELRFDWKVAPGANSGIKYNVSEEMSTAEPPVHGALGFEYQVLDDDLHPDSLEGPHRRAAALYDLIGPREDKRLRPVGEFNEARIVLDGLHGEHWLNGAKVLDYELDSADFRQRLERSKYRPIAGFAERRKGHIVLQDHGDDVWFRDLKIRELR